MARPKTPSVYPAPGQTRADLDAQWEKYKRWEESVKPDLDLFDTLSPQDLHAFVSQVLRDDGYCGISKTRGGSSICFGVMVADNKYKLYVSSADQFEAEVTALTGIPLRTR